MISDAPIETLARRIAVAAVVLATCCLPSVSMAQATCDPATSAVGPHLSHTRASFARGPLACIECHAPVCTANQAENIVFGELARKDVF